MGGRRKPGVRNRLAGELLRKGGLARQRAAKLQRRAPRAGPSPVSENFFLTGSSKRSPKEPETKRRTRRLLPRTPGLPESLVGRAHRLCDPLVGPDAYRQARGRTPRVPVQGRFVLGSLCDRRLRSRVRRRKVRPHLGHWTLKGRPPAPERFASPERAGEALRLTRGAGIAPLSGKPAGAFGVNARVVTSMLTILSIRYERSSCVWTFRA